MSFTKDNIGQFKNTLLNKLAESVFYRKEDADNNKFWSKYASEEFDKFSKIVSESVNFNKLTEEELILWGFQKYKDKGLYLIPLYLYKAVRNGTEVESIFGNKIIVGTDHFDNDNRGGMLAYGVYPIKEGENI